MRCSPNRSRTDVSAVNSPPGSGHRPAYVRFDNGSEFVAHAVNDWCRFNSASSLFIDPGTPWKNAWIESVDGRLRDELLNAWRFDSLLEARVIVEDWRCQGMLA